MYIKSVNDDELHYEYSGLWTYQILSLATEWTSSAHRLHNKLQV